MTERVIIPAADEVELTPRRMTDKKAGEYEPFAVGADLVPEMAHAGGGHRYHVTGLTHDVQGYPVMSADCQDQLVRRLCDKIRDNADDIVMLEEIFRDPDGSYNEKNKFWSSWSIRDLIASLPEDKRGVFTKRIEALKQTYAEMSGVYQKAKAEGRGADVPLK